MTSEERDRAALIRAAAAIWGEEVAVTLSELLPPSGDRPATQRDIEGVLAAIDAMDERHESRLDGMTSRLDGMASQLDGMASRLDGTESRLDGMASQLDGTESRLDGMASQLDGMASRLDGTESRLDGLHAHLDGMESRFDRRLDERLDALADRMTASFERRISDAVTTQTRTLVFSQLGSLVVIAALAFGFR